MMPRHSHPVNPRAVGIRYHRLSAISFIIAVLCLLSSAAWAADLHRLDHLTDTERRQSVQQLLRAGFVCLTQYYDYERAYHYSRQALELCEYYGYKDQLPYAYMNLGNILHTMNEVRQRRDYQAEVLELYRKSMRVCIDQRDWETLMPVMCNVASLLLDEDSLQLIRPDIDTFLHLDVPDSVSLKTYTTQLCLGMKEASLHHYDQALGHFDQMEAATDDTPPRERYAILAMMCRSKIYVLTGQTEKAAGQLLRALEQSEQHHAPDVSMELYSKLSVLYEAGGHRQLARDYHYRYLQTKDSLLNYSKLGDVDKLRLEDEMKKVEELSQKRASQQKQLVLMLCVLSVIVGLLLLLVRNYRRLREDHRALYRQNMEALQHEVGERQRMRRYRGSSLDEEEKETIASRIADVLENSSKIYEEGFTLNRLAELVGSNYKNVSQVINERYGQNFNQLMAKYRIREACRRLDDTEHYGQYSIEGIAASVGFKSRSNFVVIFKRQTGLTPSEFQRMAREHRPVSGEAD